MIYTPLVMNNCPSVESGQAGKAEACKGCPNMAKCQTSNPDPYKAIIHENLKGIKLIVAILSGKGGVGKSTIACNIARSLAAKNIRTLLLDYDLSGPSVPRLTNTVNYIIPRKENIYEAISVEKNFSVISVGHMENLNDKSIIFNASAKNHTIKTILTNFTFHDVDVMIVDTPPNITEEHLSLYNYMPETKGIVVTTPQKFSTNDVRRQLMFCKKAKIQILGLVENMKGFNCLNCGHINKIFDEGSIETLCKENEIRYLGFFDLQKYIAKQSDFGNRVEHPLYDAITDQIIKIII